MHYGVKRALIPAIMGKTLMYLIVAYSGRFTIRFVEDLFGVEGIGISVVVGIALWLVLLITVYVGMFRVDWEKQFKKYLTEEEKDNSDK